jgi:glycosyltransferase involved in cell wall biosynthesis
VPDAPLAHDVPRAPNATGTPILVDIDDFDIALRHSRASSAGVPAWRRWLFARQRRQLQRIIPPALERCDGLWVSNDADRSLPGLRRAVYLPNIPFSLPGDEPPPASPSPPDPIVLFVGTLAHVPNCEGIDLFLDRAWPVVRDALPSARLVIVGSGLADSMRRRWSAVAGVEPVGLVHDLASHYHRCALVVAPIFSGAGTNIKVAEALSYGRTVVATTTAMRGYEQVLRHEQSVWIARDARQMAQGCIELLSNPDRRDRMAECGRQIVTRRFSFDRFKQAVSDLLLQSAAGALAPGALTPNRSPPC